MLAVGILLAKGWSVVRRKLTARSRIIYGVIENRSVCCASTAVDSLSLAGTRHAQVP